MTCSAWPDFDGNSGDIDPDGQKVLSARSANEDTRGGSSRGCDRGRLDGPRDGWARRLRGDNNSRMHFNSTNRLAGYFLV